MSRRVPERSHDDYPLVIRLTGQIEHPQYWAETVSFRYAIKYGASEAYLPQKLPVLRGLMKSQDRSVCVIQSLMLAEFPRYSCLVPRKIAQHGPPVVFRFLLPKPHESTPFATHVSLRQFRPALSDN